VAPAVLHYTTPRSAPALATDLGVMLSSRTRSGRWGVLVVSLTRGDTLYSYNPDELLAPASNMKLYTAALALDQFGPDHQFKTEVLRDGPLAADGSVSGNLILRGDGDPALSSRFLQGGSSAPMDLLAQLVAGAGVKHVRGNLIADATAFDDRRIPEGWQPRYLQASYAARVSALSLNENLIWIEVAPGRSAKETPRVTFDPPTELPLLNHVRTVAGSRGSSIIVRHAPGGGIEARGWIGSRALPRRFQMVVEDPALFTAGAFRRALEAHGVTVEGTVEFGTTPPGAERITSIPSPPLARLLSVMNRESINHYAELLFRNAARRAFPNEPGSVEAGNRLLQQFMTEKVGADSGTSYAADGSGLSVLDRATSRSLVQLLAYAHRAPWGNVFHASLPVAGESELLRYRMRATPAQGNLHAKTGTTNTVISLGGYVTAQDGEVLAFAFVYNGTDRWNAKVTIDAMGATLAGFARN
jgi:D-alanyl-D-alanine carboxypeptidase/D-alanyl-D-alanine-endopeptidase (penicillin-binding protein 4)